jgi:alkylation response protein AidB-like acyl-CoA dehydrogenase
MTALEEFRLAVREWLADNLSGDFAALRGLGGPGREHEAYDERIEWDRHLAASGWTCLGWPAEYGGRDASVEERVVFHEEYARAEAPARVSHVGEELLGPTLIALGTDEQRERFLPPIKRVDELWCQGYSEPGAGSDLASVSTSAVLVKGEGEAGGEWVITGQKVWTSLAHVAQWCFAVVRTTPGSKRHAGLSYLLVPMNQPGVDVRPIEQLTGGSEFNEVFFSSARTAANLVVGEVGGGWQVAMATLGFERGAATLGLQVGFRRELDALVQVARDTGVLDDPVMREKLTRARIGLDVMRWHALRTIDGEGASVTKLVWANWHRGLGELAMEVLGAAGMVTDGSALSEWQRLFLFSRADTIYGGSNEIQRNIIAERVLGLPREARA